MDTEKYIVTAAAKRVEKIFELFGWTWSPKGRKVKVTWRRAYKDIQAYIRTIKQSAAYKSSNLNIISIGGGRLYARATWSDEGEIQLESIEILVQVGFIPREVITW